jgi:LuxR family transcriptional regulator, maltose regulon positive regulatory protein
MVVGSGPSSVVTRRELFGLLSTDGGRGVTLLSAPPGSGKTVLLRSWLEDAGAGDRVAWVSVDREERDAQHFWLSVIAELRMALGADGSVERVEGTPTFDGETVVDRLIADLELLEQPLVLVLDDLHELRSGDALRQLEALLARRPALLRVVMASRRDPRLGLHRLRLAGELREIRSTDLRFSLDEAREMLAAAGVTLREDSLEQLYERTEGWAAGLRLAALALAGHPDPERFVAEFSGSERTVADYLFAEVLERQPEEARRLLLRTSILDRVNSALGDLLTGATGSRRLLQELEEQNAFVVSLDASRSWFRYHHLFADLLRLELERTEPEAVQELHRGAASWFADNGYVVEGVRHAQAAEQWALAAQLLADHSFGLWLDGRGATTYALLDGFPESVVSSDPELARVFAGGALWRGSLADAETYLAVAERNAAQVPTERRPRFQIRLSLTRLQHARRRGHFASAIDEAQPLLAADSSTAGETGLDVDSRAAALMHLGIVELWSGRFEESEAHLEQGLGFARLAGRPYLETQCLAYLAVARARRSFGPARDAALEALSIAEKHGWEGDGVVGAALVALGTIDVWQGRFADAEHWLKRAEGVVRADLEPASALLLQVATGRLLAARAQLTAAVGAFRAAARLEALLAAPQFMTFPARRLLAQMLAQLGDAEGARATLAELTRDAPDSDMTRTALAQVHLSSGDPHAAIDVLLAVLDASPPPGPLLRVEALLLDAAARDLLGEARAAEADVESALELAEPERIVWPFVVTPARDLVERHARHRSAHGGLLKEILGLLATSSPPARPSDPVPLQEELSESEMRVLRYLPSNLSAAEIGSELFLSVFTVKTHIRHIYGKLGVHRRSEAVERARELGLLSPPSRLR